MLLNLPLRNTSIFLHVCGLTLRELVTDKGVEIVEFSTNPGLCTAYVERHQKIQKFKNFHLGMNLLEVVVKISFNEGQCKQCNNLNHKFF